MSRKFCGFVLAAFVFCETGAQPFFRNQFESKGLVEKFPTFSDSVVVWEPFDVSTIGIQILSGVGGCIAAVLLQYHFRQAAGKKLTTFVFFTGMGFATGVYLGGKWMGRNGKFVPTAIYPAIAAAGFALIAGGQQHGGDLFRNRSRSLPRRSGNGVCCRPFSWLSFLSDSNVPTT